MGRKVHLMAITVWGAIGCCDAAHAFLYASMDIDISIRKEYVQTDASEPAPNLPTPWCVSIGSRSSTWALEAELTPPPGSTLFPGTLALGETVCFATLAELTAAMPIGTYTLTALMEAADTNDPPVPVNVSFRIDEPFSMPVEVPRIQDLTWSEDFLYAHVDVPLLLSLMDDPDVASFPHYRLVADRPDGTWWYTAVSVGSPAGKLNYVRDPNPYRVAYSFLDELYAVSSPYRIAVTYEVRTILDMVLQPDPELRMTAAANAIRFVGSGLLPQREYELECTERLSASSAWVPIASFAATATTHTVSGFTLSGDGNAYRLRLVPN